MHRTITPQQIRRFRTTVYTHFDREGRTLPWRTGYDPYHILVSEIMLQQTQVDRVIDKFTPFLRAFPTLHALAQAPLDDVIARWQGLGYNRRAAALRNAARMIEKDFGGIVPQEPEQLHTLPGIGSATAASIAAFAFNKPVVFLETNIRTVLIHHFFSDKASVPDNDLIEIAAAALDRKNPRKWYSALMDYGTMLKKTVGNLSRKSITYKKQSPFAGSRRQIRGAVLKCLVTMRQGTPAAIAGAIDRNAADITPVLDALVKEGLLHKEKRHYRIAR